MACRASPKWATIGRVPHQLGHHTHTHTHRGQIPREWRWARGHGEEWRSPREIGKRLERRNNNSDGGRNRLGADRTKVGPSQRKQVKMPPRAQGVAGQVKLAIAIDLVSLDLFKPVGDGRHLGDVERSGKGPNPLQLGGRTSGGTTSSNFGALPSSSPPASALCPCLSPLRDNAVSCPSSPGGRLSTQWTTLRQLYGEAPALRSKRARLACCGRRSAVTKMATDVIHIGVRACGR